MIKLNKIPILLIICVVIISAAFGLFILIDKDDKENNKVLFDKAFTVNIYGTQGEGYVDIEFNEDYLKGFMLSDNTNLNKDHIELDINRPNNLSNEDAFTVKILNEGILKEKGIEFDKYKMSYRVSGLKDGIDYDVFKDFKIYIDGGEVMLDNSDCSNFIKDNVIFFIKNKLDSYKEGDTVVVGVYVDMNVATDNGYNIKELEKEYVLMEQEKTND